MSSAESVVKQQLQWEHIQEWIKLDPTNERTMRQAVRFVLVHAFGTEEQYHYDAEFHAKVSQAERLLEVLQAAHSDGGDGA